MNEYFKDFVEFESILFGADHKYREHVDHVINVWAIGIVILFKFNLIKKIILNDDVQKSDKTFSFEIHEIKNYEETNDRQLKLSKGEIIVIWTLIALCHDLGYPIEKASRINEKLKKIINHFGQVTIEEFNYNFSLLNNFLVEKFLNIISSKAF